jgi:very-short-patch-repair endonuclease
MTDFDHSSYLRDVAVAFGRRETTRMAEALAAMPFSKAGTSPIETMFGCALYVEMEFRLDVWAGIVESAFSRQSTNQFEKLALAPVEGIYAFSQVEVDIYRVDFMVALRSLDLGTAFYAVELDGHEFHEKTKEQVARDKARDRYLQSRGIAVFRFSGSEIWKDADGCAASFLDDAYAALEARSKA